MRDEISLGGNLQDTVRVGDTVRRRTGPWTPAVHALLRFLEERDFPAPRVRGIDERGREVLTYVEGEAHSGTLEPLPDRVMDERHLVAAARLLRRYHDVVAVFQPPADARWRVVAPTEHEIICHNDWSPWNALFRDGTLTMVLDWDLAGPGSRVWGVANGVASWAPLYSGHRKHTVDQMVARAQLFLDEYGLDDRTGLVPTLRLQFKHIATVIEAEAENGDPGMRRLLDWGVPQRMRGVDLEFLDRHRAELDAL